MALSRRAFVRSLTGRKPPEPRPSAPDPPAADLPRVSPNVVARGREAGHAIPLPPDVEATIYLASTESASGPGVRAREALAAHYSADPTRAARPRLREQELRAALAGHHGIDAACLVTGAGSTELLRSATRAFTSNKASLVTSAPTYAACANAATQAGRAVVAVPALPDGSTDLDALAEATSGAGLVYLANPNNPTGTLHGPAAVGAFVARVHAASPETVVAIDEAYHDYVVAPDHDSAVEMAVTTPRVVVTRSFSKLHGLAGLRLGYAMGYADTMKALARHIMPNAANAMAYGPALAALDDTVHIARERARNASVRALLVNAFTRLGCRVSESQTNFIFTRVGVPASIFRDACAREGVTIARDFAPLADAWVRISVGTYDEVIRAIPTFERVLAELRRHHPDR